MINTPNNVQTSALLRRSRDLNYEFDPEVSIPTRYLSLYDDSLFKSNLEDNFPHIEAGICRELRNENVDKAISVFNEELDVVYRKSKIRLPAVNEKDSVLMEKANEQFENYRKCVRGEIEADKSEMLKRYVESRKLITKEICNKEHQKWSELTADTNCKRLWDKISWKGSISKDTTSSPIIEDLTLHFEKLHEGGKEDLEKIEQLETDIYNYELDKPVTSTELDEAMKKMKNGGFDHRIDKFKTIVNVMSPIIVLLMNILFYVAYPIKLAISLLTAIPKKGNLSLAKNYRGIQMMAALAVLYDRIITLRIVKWIIAKIHDVQSGFQKFKSTLHQIFTLRLLSEIAKKNNITLYIGLFDLEKAFDKISRYKLLKKLVKMGISNIMLQALKRLYLGTYCILTYGSEFSQRFRTYCGVRQGAASSALLFIGFINDIVDYLKQRCPPEPLLDDLHCLLHADDTAILSTDRVLFINKCNYMLDYFSENSLSLNLSKSGFLVINGSNADKKNLHLKNGILEYKNILTYLGIKISDSGEIKRDIESYVDGKRANITIKFGNFCRKNFLAPLFIKLQVLNTCVSAALIYGCETWASASIKQIEVLYRQGLKTALSVRCSVNNEIVYTESGQLPLSVRITKQQLNFWMKLKLYLQNKPNHYISKLINTAKQSNIPYINYYINLETLYTDTTNCWNILKQEHLTKCNQAIRNASQIDQLSKLGAYHQVNPSLTTPKYDGKPEFQRICITRYRTGSNNLAIEKGRYANIDREERLCTCNLDVQSLKHVLLDCHLLNDIRTKYGVTDMVNGVMNDCFLVEMESILNIK